MILALSLLFVSCKKEEKGTDQTPITKASDYFPMSVGNYWVYEMFEIDTNGNEVNMGWLDSIYVSEKEVIRGETYYLFESGNRGPGGCFTTSVRDSSGYLVNWEGTILFAPDDFSDTLAVDVEMLSETDTLYVGYSKMEKVPDRISLKAGDFEALICRNRYHTPLIGAALEYRELLEYRAPRVGLIIKQCASLADPKIREGRLVRYHIHQ